MHPRRPQCQLLPLSSARWRLQDPRGEGRPVRTVLPASLTRFGGSVSLTQFPAGDEQAAEILGADSVGTLHLAAEERGPCLDARGAQYSGGAGKDPI